MRIMAKTLIAVTIAAIALGSPFVASAAPRLDAGEEAHLIFMREEEKLARDVYLTLGAMYPNNPIFMTIAEDSEQRHTDTMLARIFHELPAATANMPILPGVLGCRTLRRTVQVRLGSNPLRLPGGTVTFTVSRRQFMKYPG